MLQVIKAEEVRDGEPRIWIETPQPVMHTESRRDRGCQPCGFAIVDRPAPTPAADPLATVRAALDVASKATTGEWECEPVDVFGTLTEWAALIGPRRPGSDWPRKSDLRHEDAVAIVAMHNAAPAIAELCAEVDRLQCDKAALVKHIDYNPSLRIRELEATRAKLAEAKRLGMEACGLARDAIEAARDVQAPDGYDAGLDGLSVPVRAACVVVAVGCLNVINRIAAALEAL